MSSTAHQRQALATSQVAEISTREIETRLRVSAKAQLDTRTPGGAAVSSLVTSYSAGSTPGQSATNAGVAALCASKKPAAQEACKGATLGATYGSAVCSVAGPAPAAICGAVGAAFGAMMGAIDSVRTRGQESGSSLDIAWIMADVALTNAICSIGNTYRGATGKTINADQCVALLKEAMSSLGSKMTDRIWGPSICSSYWQKLPCNVPSGTSNPGYHRWRVMESWWMAKKRYGSCIDKGDIIKNAAWTDKISTRRDRDERMRSLTKTIGIAAQAVIATIVNLADEQAQYIAQNNAQNNAKQDCLNQTLAPIYLERRKAQMPRQVRSDYASRLEAGASCAELVKTLPPPLGPGAATIAAVAAAASGMAQSYGEQMRRNAAILRAAGYSPEWATNKDVVRQAKIVVGLKWGLAATMLGAGAYLAFGPKLPKNLLPR